MDITGQVLVDYSAGTTSTSMALFCRVVLRRNNQTKTAGFSRINQGLCLTGFVLPFGCGGKTRNEVGISLKTR
ncbi:MAG TPA: hypothetical protein PKB02_00600 [Anaerohalosphaeraceae bacterium]|nr:hypothetical protein [Anaerohalosphaeraceae bacterium]